jgi:hypothetical protein
MTNIQVAHEKLIVDFSKDNVKMTNLESGTKTIDDSTPAVCDICTCSLGTFKQIKNSISPERMTLAARNGYRPEKEIERFDELMQKESKALAKKAKEMFIASWLEMVNKGETPWALCDKCNEKMSTFVSE